MRRFGRLTLVAVEWARGSGVKIIPLCPFAKAVFDRVMPQPNQVERKRDDVCVKAADLLAFLP